jgi:hypothetical protein
MIRIAHCSVFDNEVTLLTDVDGLANDVLCPCFESGIDRCQRKLHSHDNTVQAAPLTTHAISHHYPEHVARCHFLVA